MSELILMTKIFIIESPSFIDLIENRKEGEALGKTLDLAKIENMTFSVSNIETLRIAFNRISAEVNIIKGDLGAVHLHFSMHGSKDGVVLSDKTFIEWKTFYTFLKEFNDSIGYINLPSGLQIAPTYLAFSVCDGFEARKIKEYGLESPYTGLIGPTHPVGWSDSLLAFSIFYHNTILKKLGISIALENMNKIIGADNLFRADSGKGMTLKQ